VVEKEIFSKPPLNALIDPRVTRKKSPWEIHISELLDMFLKALVESRLFDLRAAGTAALTSATIYRFKVESLFLFERLQRERRMIDATEPPQIVVMPFRYEVYSTNVGDLFEALTKILDEIVIQDRELSTVSSALLEEAPPPNPEDYLLTLISSQTAFRTILRERIGGGGRISLSELLKGMTLIEAARSFILLLFLANGGEVVLEQAEEDVMIILVG
jgi:segregation and condensation protein A